MKQQIDRTKLKIIADSLIVGIFAGLIVSAFRWLIQHGLPVWLWLYQQSTHHFNWLLMMGVIFIVTLITGLLIKSQPHIMGSGIPEVELQLKGQLTLNPFPLLWRKFVAGALMISSGGMLGREGPSIQLGGLVGQLYAEKRQLNEQQWRLMLAAGASAGLSAAFGAPLAGAMFIMEEVAHSFSLLLWLSALSSALAADLISELVFGLHPVLDVHYTQMLPPRYFWLLLVMGLFLGGFGRLYQKVTLGMPRLYRHIPRLPRHFHGVIMLLLVWPLGILWPQVLGGGNDVIHLLGSQHWPLLWLLGVVIARFIYSAISFGSGVPGGIFFANFGTWGSSRWLVRVICLKFKSITRSIYSQPHYHQHGRLLCLH